MPVTFIYRIGNNPKTYYGKLNMGLSDDFPVDEEAKDQLVIGLRKYGLKHVSKKLLKVAILSVYNANMYYASAKENKVFDFVCEQRRGRQTEYWVNGIKLSDQRLNADQRPNNEIPPPPNPLNLRDFLHDTTR